MLSTQAPHELISKEIGRPLKLMAHATLVQPSEMATMPLNRGRGTRLGSSTSPWLSEALKEIKDVGSFQNQEPGYNLLSSRRRNLDFQVDLMAGRPNQQEYGGQQV